MTKSLKLLIGLLLILGIFAPIGLYSNMVNEKAIIFEQNRETTMNYFKTNLNMSEEEVIEFFKKQDVEYQVLDNTEDIHKKYEELLSSSLDLSNSERDVLTNPNKTIDLTNLPNLNLIIVGISKEANVLSPKKIISIIENFKNKSQYEVYTYSKEGLKSQSTYFTIFEQLKNGYPSQDIGHLRINFDTEFPQIFVVTDGKLDIEQSKKLIQNTPYINIKGQFMWEETE